MTPRDENLRLILEDDAISASFEGWERAQTEWFFCDQYENRHAGPPTLADAIWFESLSDRRHIEREADDLARETRRAEEDERDQWNIAKAQGF